MTEQWNSILTSQWTLFVMMSHGLHYSAVLMTHCVPVGCIPTLILKENILINIYLCHIS